MGEGFIGHAMDRTCQDEWVQNQMDRKNIHSKGGSPNRASVCKSVFSSLMSRLIMGCFVQFMGMSIHIRWITGYGGTHGVWGGFT